MRLLASSALAAALVALPLSSGTAQVLPGGHHARGAGDSYAATVRQAADLVTARLKDAWDRRDAGAVAALCAKDGVLIVGDGTVLRGRAAIREYLAGNLPLTYPVTLETTDFGMSGELAYNAGVATYEMADGAGNSSAHAGPYSLVLRTQDSDVWEVQLLTLPGPAAGTGASVVRARPEGPAGGAGGRACDQAASECPQEGQKRAPVPDTVAPQASHFPGK